MEENKQAVFISYGWGGEQEENVDQHNQVVEQREWKINHDRLDLGYKGSISAFIEHIWQGNCINVFITEKYLRSLNCTVELVEIAENKHCHEHDFSIVLVDADIYFPVLTIAYVRHWDEIRTEQTAMIKELDPISLQDIRDDTDIDHRRDNLLGMTSISKDMNTLVPEMHRVFEFSELYDSSMRRMEADKEKPFAGVRESMKEVTQDKPPVEENVTVKNGGIGIGSINIGRGAGANIVMGDNNGIEASKKV